MNVSGFLQEIWCRQNVYSNKKQIAIIIVNVIITIICNIFKFVRNTSGPITVQNEYKASAWIQEFLWYCYLNICYLITTLKSRDMSIRMLCSRKLAVMCNSRHLTSYQSVNTQAHVAFYVRCTDFHFKNLQWVSLNGAAVQCITQHYKQTTLRETKMDTTCFEIKLLDFERSNFALSPELDHTNF
jgi:hypothetical protein